MQINNRQSAIVNRKGVYQAFDANGNVTADERWRIAGTVDGGARIDTDTTRIAPFPEPRGESLTFELGPGLQLRSLAIHALKRRRESRVSFTPTHTSCCWRLDEVSKTRDFSWTDDCEIDYNSPLFNTATLWRTRLAPGQSRAFDVVFLDPVTFEPVRMRQIYTRASEEAHETRFGVMRLIHWWLDFGGEGTNMSHFWSDGSGVIFDFAASGGGGFQLAAVNFPG